MGIIGSDVDIASGAMGTLSKKASQPPDYPTLHAVQHRPLRLHSMALHQTDHKDRSLDPFKIANEASEALKAS
jgi:hypothetical protein